MPRIRLFRTSSFRLALLYAGLLTASVLVLFGVTYWFATDYATQDEDNEIGVEFASIQDEAQLSGQARCGLMPKRVSASSIARSHSRSITATSAVPPARDPASESICLRGMAHATLTIGRRRRSLIRRPSRRFLRPALRSSTYWSRTRRAAKSGCSAAPAWARPSSFSN